MYCPTITFCFVLSSLLEIDIEKHYVVLASEGLLKINAETKLKVIEFGMGPKICANMCPILDFSLPDSLLHLLPPPPNPMHKTRMGNLFCNLLCNRKPGSLPRSRETALYSYLFQNKLVHRCICLIFSQTCMAQRLCPIMSAWNTRTVSITSVDS